jgi:hypothetical protein
MATWVGVIVVTNERADFWSQVTGRGVHGQGEVPPRVLIDCGARFGAVQPLAAALAGKLETEAIAFIVQTVSDAHAIWVYRGTALVRTLEYSRDEGGWLVREGEPQPWEAAYFSQGDPPSTTMNMIAVCDQLGVTGERPNAVYRPPTLWRRLFRRGYCARDTCTRSRSPSRDTVMVQGRQQTAQSSTSVPCVSGSTYRSTHSRQ